MLNSIKKMLTAFEKEDINYCHWKSNEHLEEALNGDTDLDMLFLPSQRHSLEKVLSNCGLKRFRATPLMQYNAIEDYIGFDEREGKIWHLHIHYRLSLGEKHLKGYTLPWNNYIIKNSKYNEELGVYCSDENVEYLLLLIRLSLKLRYRDYGKKIGNDDIKELDWLLSRIDNSNVFDMIDNLLGRNLLKEFKYLVGKRITKKSELIKLQKKLREELKPFHSYSKFSSWTTRTRREVFWIIGGVFRRLGINSFKPSRRISPAGGLVVAILGCDGAGKSTTLKYVKKEFGKKIDISNVYMGSGDGSSSLLRIPMRMVAKKVGGKGVGNSFVDPKNKLGLKKKTKYFLYTLAKTIWAVTLASEKKRKLKAITRARNNGLLVLTDRYPQVETLGYNDGPLLYKWMESKNKVLKSIANWEFKIYERGYLNPPDIIIKLVVSPETAIKRKPEMTIEEIERKINAVKAMNFAMTQREVCTETNMLESCSEVMGIIWKEI